MQHNYYNAPCAYDLEQAETQRLAALYTKLSTKLMQLASVEHHEAQRQLQQDIEAANESLLELEEVVDEAIAILEQLPDGALVLDPQDLICICAQSEQAKRFLGSAH